MDNHHCLISKSMISCGIGEVHNISEDPHKVLYAMANYLYHPARGTPFGAYIWSGLINGNAANLDKYIRTLANYGFWPERFAEIDNPKTGNKVDLYVWDIPHEEFKKWYIGERVKRANKI